MKASVMLPLSMKDLAIHSVHQTTRLAQLPPTIVASKAKPSQEAVKERLLR